MITINSLPHFQATMNFIATCLIIAGFYFIKVKENKDAHKKCMLGAVLTSAIFLISYLTYHYVVGTVKFGGEGTVRTIYFVILFTHTILAGVVPILIGMSIWKALKGNIEGHKKIVKYTFPIWLFVSITGLIIYAMLYHIYGAAK